jgi:undecaprenyl-diphosphatase
MWKFISVRDHRLMHRVHRWRAPRWIRLWMVYATRGGDGWLWYVLGFAVLLFGGGGKAFEAVAASGLAAAVGIALFIWLKRKTRRRRPCAIEPHCWAKLLPPDHFSFPSGHSITAFAVTLPLGMSYPAIMLVLMFCAVSVAVSRVVLGLHFLSDVVAGSAIGSALGYFAFRLLT